MNITSLKPMKGLALVELKKPAEEVSGLIIPVKYKVKESGGRVIAVHPDLDVKIGEEIIFSDLKDSDIFEQDGNEYCLVREQSIIAVVEGGLE